MLLTNYLLECFQQSHPLNALVLLLTHHLQKLVKLDCVVNLIFTNFSDHIKQIVLYVQDSCECIFSVIILCIYLVDADQGFSSQCQALWRTAPHFHLYQKEEKLLCSQLSGLCSEDKQPKSKRSVRLLF